MKSHPTALALSLSALVLGGAALPARAGTVLVAPIVDDTWISEAAPTSLAGAYAPLVVKRGQDGSAGRALVRADLSAVPAGSLVRSATLRLFATKANAASLVVRRLLEPFSEATATWKTKPDASQVVSGGGFVPGQGWASIDVTASVRMFVHEGVENHGWLLKYEVEETFLDLVEFVSKDTAAPGFAPYLELDLVASPLGVGPDREFAQLEDAAEVLSTMPSFPVTIEVDGGSSYEPANLEGLEGTAEAPILIAGVGPEKPVFEGSGLSVLRLDDSSFVTLRDLRVVVSEDGQKGVHVDDSSRVVLEGLDVRSDDGGEVGILLHDTDLSEVLRCRVAGGTLGIGVTGDAAEGNVISDSEVFRTAEVGIGVDGFARSNRVVHNTIVDAGAIALCLLPDLDDVGAGPGNVFAQNAVRTGGVAIAWLPDPLGLPPAGTVFDRNALDLAPGGYAALADGLAIWGSPAALEQDLGLGSRGLVGDLHLADPDAADPGRARLEAWSIAAGYPIDSPLVDAGVAGWSSDASIDGIARPAGSAPDLGARETKRTARSPGRLETLEATVLAEPVLPGQPVDLLVLAFDGAGEPALSFAGEVEVREAGGGKVLASHVFSAADGAAHVFEDVAAFEVPGEYALVVRSAAKPEIAAAVEDVTVVSTPTLECDVAQDGTGDATSLSGCAAFFAEAGGAAGADLLVEVADGGLYFDHVDAAALPLAPGRSLTVRARAGRLPTIGGDLGGSPAFALSAPGTTVQGFRCRSYGFAPCFEVTAPGSVVWGNLVYSGAFGGGTGVAVTAPAAVVAHNVVRGLTIGISLEGPGASSALVAQNVVWGSTEAGVALAGAGPSNQVVFNTLFENGGAALYVSDAPNGAAASGSSFTHNIAVAGAGSPLLVFATAAGIPAGFVSDRNDLWRPGASSFSAVVNGVESTDLASWRAATGLGTASISADPLFVAPGSDFHLRSEAGHYVADLPPSEWPKDAETSPCIDAGDPSLPAGDEPVPNGGVADLGAYGRTAEASLSPAP